MRRAKGVWWVALSFACAGGSAALPPDVPVRPELGDSLSRLLQKLPHAEAPGPDVEVTELRVMAAGAQPWLTLDPQVAEGQPGLVAVVAGRRCAERRGFHRLRAARASWFVLQDGALVAFDYDGFGQRCAARPAYVPAPPADVAVERMLLRYVSQRWPADRIGPDERLARGLALLEAERPDDALAELQVFDREIAELQRRAQETEDESERDTLQDEVDRLRPLRAQLDRALDEWRERHGENAWDG